MYWMRRCGVRAGSLRDEADTFLAGMMDAACRPATRSARSHARGADKGRCLRVSRRSLGVMLDEANVPIDGRFVVVPAWFHGLLLKDERFISPGRRPVDRVSRNAQVGEAAGFSILKSNNVPNTTGAKYASSPATRWPRPTSSRSSTCRPTSPRNASATPSKACTCTVRRS